MTEKALRLVIPRIEVGLSIDPATHIHKRLLKAGFDFGTVIELYTDFQLDAYVYTQKLKGGNQ